MIITVLIIIGMLVTGTINTILTKYQDLTCVQFCDTDNPVYFQQPIWQSLNMFLGEFCCLLVYSIYHALKKKDVLEEEIVENDETSRLLEEDTIVRHPSILENFLFIFPTLCDLTSSTLMNIGLLFISASVYQMLRGSMVLFTGIFSMVFLRRKVKWTGLLIVFFGIFIVGTSSVLEKSGKVSFVGIVFVMLAQIFSALQYVIEERIMTSYKFPALLAVGLEGLFGTVIISIGLPILLTKNIDSQFMNIKDGFYQIISHPEIYWSAIAIIFSISLFNWFGLLITKKISSTSRATVDIMRTVFIWLVSLYLEWEAFQILQVVGFIIMIYGIFVFNNLISIKIKCGSD
jgi:drug/metabolite transporter (DMT)-like permease